MTKISRRDFLKLTVVSATAAGTAGLTACSNSSGSNKITVLNYFPQSVASGDPKPDSIILWTRVVDQDRPSMDLTLTLQMATDSDFTTGTMEFANLDALAANGNCLKVKVTGLSAGTTYYYRFVYVDSDGRTTFTNTGRTKTAVQGNSNVRYAVLSCQDYVGRYYNTLKRLVEYSEEAGNDLDFVVHVGDYIYETTGDPDFQSSAGARSVSFTDTAGALAVSEGGETFFAAQSLSNYRELYQTYRSDMMLQRVHERFPVIAIWDDHEFSDDCFGDTATYRNGKHEVFDGSRDLEQSEERRTNAEQAYFEFMPIDDDSGQTTTGEQVRGDTDRWPNASGLNRSFNFGDNFELLVTDYRSNRPDHPIPENANPGLLVTDSTGAATLSDTMMLAIANGIIQQLGGPADYYSSIDDFADTSGHSLAGNPFASFASYDIAGYFNLATGQAADLTSQQISDILLAFAAGMTNEGYPSIAAFLKAQTDMTGKGISIFFYDQFATAFNALVDAGQVPASLNKVPTVTELVVQASGASTADISDGRGVSYALLGKSSFFSEFGSRYFVVKDVYDFCAAFFSTVNADYDNALGDTQTTWLSNTIAASSAAFVGIGNSTSTASIVLDFRASGPLAADAVNLPAQFQQRFYLNADHWDGFPIRKATLLNTVSGTAAATGQTGAFFFAGDIHASFVSNSTDTSARSIPDFTGPAVASGTWGAFVENGLNSIITSAQAAGVTFDAAALAAAQKLAVTELDNSLTASALAAAGAAAGAYPLAHASTRRHGFMVFEVSASDVSVNYHTTGESNALQSGYGASSATTAAKFCTDTFTYTGFGGGVSGSGSC